MCACRKMNTRSNTCRIVQLLGETMIFLKLQLLDCNCMSTQLCSWWRSETTLVQMAKAITVQAQDIKAQATREDFPREIPHTITMASRLRDFRRMLRWTSRS